MSVVVITPPDPIVTLAEAKKHLRIDHTDDDNLIEGFCDAITEWLDGPGGWLGRAIGVQTLELRRDHLTNWPCGWPATLRTRHYDLIDLPFPPLVSIVSVKYIDADGVEQTVAGTVYTLSQRGISLAHNQSWPSIRSDIEGVKIQYVAGYEIVPAAIKAAVLLIVAHLYENRGASPADALDGAAGALLAPYRVWSV